MAYTPSQILVAICPALAADAVALPIFLELSIQKTDSGFFGADYAQAVALRAAHMYTMSRPGREGGAVTSKTEGRLSMSFAAPAGAAAGSNLALSSYGQELRGLIRLHGPGVTVEGEYDMESEE
jgi:hypothetical protein